jgi:hypothetical protein
MNRPLVIPSEEVFEHLPVPIRREELVVVS